MCAVSWTTWLPLSCVPARCVVSSCCVACAVSWATWLLFTGVLGRMCCVACAMSWATWLLLTGVLTRCIVLQLRCPGPLGSCSPVCSLGALRCACAGSWATWLPFTGVLARCAALGVFAVSWTTLLLFAGVMARCVVSRARCPGPVGSCSPGCSLGALCCVCGVLGHLAPVHRCARPLCCVACAVSPANWLPVSGVLARCGALGVCGILDHFATVRRCDGSVCSVTCSVSWANRLLFTGVLALCFVLCVRCAGPLGSCSPVCPPGVFRCVCGVLGHLAPVHQCARSMCCVACAVSSSSWLLSSGVLARCVVLCVVCVVLRLPGFAVGRALVHLNGGFL